MPRLSCGFYLGFLFLSKKADNPSLAELPEKGGSIAKC